jgi:hypothetical protein
MDACRALGELGTEGARRVLVTVVEKDADPGVQCVAAEALGFLGYDPDGSSARAVARLARTTAGERTLLAAAAALGELGRRAPLEQEAVGVLVRLAAEGPSVRVRAQARRALEALAAGGP